MSTGTERSASAGVRVSKATIREDILQSFPGLFGTKTINGREINVEQEIAAHGAIHITKDSGMFEAIVMEAES